MLRDDTPTVLTEGGTVFGLFPHSVYEERQFALRSGDCLLLTTDGVTEATNDHDGESGNELVIASARAAPALGAQLIRTRILDGANRSQEDTVHLFPGLKTLRHQLHFFLRWLA